MPLQHVEVFERINAVRSQLPAHEAQFQHVVAGAAQMATFDDACASKAPDRIRLPLDVAENERNPDEVFDQVAVTVMFVDPEFAVIDELAREPLRDAAPGRSGVRGDHQFLAAHVGADHVVHAPVGEVGINDVAAEGLEPDDLAVGFMEAQPVGALVAENADFRMVHGRDFEAAGCLLGFVEGHHVTADLNGDVMRPQQF